MKIQNIWKSGILTWDDGDTLCISVVFTWFLPRARKYAESLPHRKVRIGGPAVDLMPHFLFGVKAEIGGDYPGVLQKFNPLATRTSIGCPRDCDFCSVPLVAAKKSLQMSGKLITPLTEWPDLPVLADDNLLFTPQAHFDRVCDRLEKHGWCDFNQGLDCRVLNDHHAERIARIKRPTVRMALDRVEISDAWERAFERLRKVGIAKSNIRTYCLMGDKTTPEDCWKTCKFIEARGVKPLPMWFHGLDALERNKVTPEQEKYGWNDYERRRLMQWFYQHKHAVA